MDKDQDAHKDRPDNPGFSDEKSKIPPEEKGPKKIAPGEPRTDDGETPDQPDPEPKEGTREAGPVVGNEPH